MVRIDVALAIVECREVARQRCSLMDIDPTQSLGLGHALSVFHVAVAHHDINDRHHCGHHALTYPHAAVVAQRDEHKEKEDAEEGEDVADDESTTACLEPLNLLTQRLLFATVVFYLLISWFHLFIGYCQCRIAKYLFNTLMERSCDRTSNVSMPYCRSIDAINCRLATSRSAVTRWK